MKHKSACLNISNYWISRFGCPFLVLNLFSASYFWFLNVSYVFVASQYANYSAVLVWNLCLIMHTWPSQGVFLKITANQCLPLSKPLPLLKPSALIVRKLRVLVNNDQIYFFVFPLTTADIKRKTEVKVWIVIRYKICMLLYLKYAVWNFLKFERYLCMHNFSIGKCSTSELVCSRFVVRVRARVCDTQVWICGGSVEKCLMINGGYNCKLCTLKIYCFKV